MQMNIQELDNTAQRFEHLGLRCTKNELMEAIDYYEREGWELITVVIAPENHKREMYWKRPFISRTVTTNAKAWKEAVDSGIIKETK